MRIDELNSIRSYMTSDVKKEAFIARETPDESIQLRIAKNSDSRLILLNLALNINITENVVKELFNRDKDYLTSRLKRMGHAKGGIF